MSNSYGDSPTLKFIESQGWAWKAVDSTQIELEKCPYCNKDGYGHIYFEVQPTTSPRANRDGLFTCHKCGKGGNLLSLRKDLGFIDIPTEMKRQYAANNSKDPLPDVEACHQALLNDEDALEYLLNERGYSLDIIQRQKLGVTSHHFRETGEVKALVFPYLVNGTVVWAKYRTLPSMPMAENKVPKAFSCPHGYDTVLYNGECLNSGITDIVLVEGEADCIAAMDKGVTAICGVPGANNKKAEWISEIDKIDKVYLCYDNDKVGQNAAQALASRIGIEKCYRLVIPAGKDINDWFVHHSGTLEAFEDLKANAKQFDVDGVASTEDAVQEFFDNLIGKGTIEPKYRTPWVKLNTLVGFDEGDVIDILAPEKVGKTTFGLNLMEHMVSAYGEDGIIICLEMTRDKIARKWIAMMANIADNLPKSVEESKALMQSFIDAVPMVQERVASREGHLYFCYPKYKSVDDIYSLIRNCIRRYGVKWVMLDNLQRLCDTTIGSKNRTQHLSEISKVTSQITKDHKIQMVRILQPHRIGEGKMVTTDNVDGSSQVGKDCDCMLTLHRDRIEGGSLQEFQATGYVYGEGTFSNRMKVTVGLSRYSTGGYETLDYDGARSRVSDFSMEALNNIAKYANKDVGYQNQIAKLLTSTVVQEVHSEISL